MTRASQTTHATRLNAAHALLDQGMTPAQAAQTLVRSCGLSTRQAYRYVAQARTLSAPLVVPDPKIALTVTVSERLVQRVREHVRLQGTTLSHFVTRALEAWLEQGHGRSGKR